MAFNNDRNVGVEQGVDALCGSKLVPPLATRAVSEAELRALGLMDPGDRCACGGEVFGHALEISGPGGEYCDLDVEQVHADDPARKQFAALDFGDVPRVGDLMLPDTSQVDGFPNGGCWFRFFDRSCWDDLLALNPPRCLSIQHLALMSFAFPLSKIPFISVRVADGLYHVRNPVHGERYRAATAASWFNAYVRKEGWFARNDVGKLWFGADSSDIPIVGNLLEMTENFARAGISAPRCIEVDGLTYYEHKGDSKAEKQMQETLDASPPITAEENKYASRGGVVCVGRKVYQVEKRFPHEWRHRIVDICRRGHKNRLTLAEYGIKPEQFADQDFFFTGERQGVFGHKAFGLELDRLKSELPMEYVLEAYDVLQVGRPGLLLSGMFKTWVEDKILKEKQTLVKTHEAEIKALKEAHAVALANAKETDDADEVSEAVEGVLRKRIETLEADVASKERSMKDLKKAHAKELAEAKTSADTDALKKRIVELEADVLKEKKAMEELKETHAKELADLKSAGGSDDEAVSVEPVTPETDQAVGYCYLQLFSDEGLRGDLKMRHSAEISAAKLLAELAKAGEGLWSSEKFVFENRGGVVHITQSDNGVSVSSFVASLRGLDGTYPYDGCVFGMPYAGWTARVRVQVAGGFYDVEELYDVLGHLEVTNFSLVAQRTVAREKLSSLTLRRPVDKNLRFPEDGLYVQRMNHGLNMYVHQVLAALDYKDGDKDAKRGAGHRQGPPNGSSAEGENASTKPWDFNDASMSFHNAVREMQNMLAHSESVGLTRKDFEKQHDLVWEEGTNLGDLVRNYTGLHALPAQDMLVGSTYARLVGRTFPGLANCVRLNSDEARALSYAVDDVIVFWSSEKGGAGADTYRARLMFSTKAMLVQSLGPVKTNE